METGGGNAGLHDKLEATADEFDQVYFDMTDDADDAHAPFDREGSRMRPYEFQEIACCAGVGMWCIG
jgi:hypothetical protein